MNEDIWVNDYPIVCKYAPFKSLLISVHPLVGSLREDPEIKSAVDVVACHHAIILITRLQLMMLGNWDTYCAGVCYLYLMI